MSDTVVTAKFVADTTSLQAGAQRVTTSLRGVDDGVRKTAMSMNALKGGFIAAGAAVGMLALKMGVDAVKAAAEEEKAVVKLGTALKNVGQEFRLGEVEKFVDDLQRASGVADDELRPALQSLITATGSATEAQDLLGAALDISAATGRDLTSVSIALAKASNGQFMQINRLTNGAINPAILSTKDLGLVTAELERLYGGQAQANAETFAGKIDRLTIAYDELLEAFGTGFIEGITSASDATTDMGNAFRAAEPGMQEFGKTLGELGLIISYVSPFFDDVVNTFKFAIPTALATAAAAFPPLIPLVSYIGTTFLGSKASVDALANSVDIIGVKFTGPMSAAAQAASTGIRGVGDAAEEATEELAAMKAEMDLFVASTNAISAVDAAAEKIDNLGTASVEFGTNLMGQTPKARNFRSEVVSAFEASAKAAQSLSDDLPTQRAIFTGELVKIVASLRKSGVKDKDIEAFLGSMEGLPASVADIMRAAAKAVGDTDFKTEVEKAFDKSVKAGTPMTADAMERLAEGASKAAKEQLGLTLEPELASVIETTTTALRPTAFLNGQLTGKSIGEGMANGITSTSPVVQAAVARVVAEAKAAADAAAQAQSPSRLFAELGDDLVAGIALGITRSTRYGVDAMSAAARAFTRAFMKEFFPRDMGAAESSIANAIALAEERLADARDRLRDANKEVRDAEKELNQLRRDNEEQAKAIAKAERELAKAQKDLANAKDDDARAEAKQRVKDAEEALQDARRESNKVARELEAAERALERARQAAAEAADATALAKWVEENEAALAALQKIGAQYDYITGKMEIVQGAVSSISNLLATPLGTSSDLSQMFKFGTDPRTLARNFVTLSDSIRQAFAVLTDPRIVGGAAARANTRLMNRNIRQLEQYVTQIIALQKEYEANAAQMARNEAQWRIDEAALTESLQAANAAYDAATAELARIVSERDNLINSIKSGFRSFVNDLNGITEGVTAAIKEQVTELANGVRLITQSADPTSAATAIAENMRKRLEEVRAFSQNIKTLMQRGLDPSLIRDFIQSGVSTSGVVVAELASATDEELRSINETQQELLKQSEEFATAAGDAYYGAAISAQEAARREAQAAVDAAQKALDDARAAYEAERARLEAEQQRIETEIGALTAQIEALITNMMATLVPATEAAAQASIDAMIAQFKKDFPELKKELGILMDALAESMRRTVTIEVEADTSGVSGPGRSGRSRFAPGSVVVQTPATGKSVMVSPNAVSVSITAGSSVDRSSLTAQVKAAVDESLQELAREIVSA